MIIDQKLLAQLTFDGTQFHTVVAATLDVFGTFYCYKPITKIKKLYENISLVKRESYM